MNKKITLLIVALTFLIVLTTNIFALGITPGRTTIDFEPGLERTVEFSVINSDQKEMNLVVLVQGELKDYIEVSNEIFNMPAHERERKLSYKINLPNNLDSGTRIGEIVVVQLPDKFVETSEASIGASLAVITQLHVRVPYPGKYAEASLNVVGPDSEGTVHFVLPVVNRGGLDLVKVEAIIDIYSGLNEKVETLNTNQIGILSGERKEIAVQWNPEVPPGRYKAVATLIYDEETKTIEKEFNVGQQVLDVERIEVNDFRLGEIAKFEILVENKWGEEIKGAFAEMFVYNNEGDVMAEIKSPNYDVAPLEKRLMTAFWDTRGVRVGTYESELFLKFGQQSSQHDLQLEVSERNIRVIGVGYVISDDTGRDSDLVTILIIVVIVLIGINLLWFLYFRKKLVSRKKN